MTDTPDTPQSTGPQTPQPPAPPSPPDALQHYRIEQLEKALEKLQAKQDALEGATTQRIDATISNQTALYGNHLDTLSHWGIIISGAFAIFGYFGARAFIKKSVDDKINTAVKGRLEKIDAKLAQVDSVLAEHSARQIEHGKEIEALRAFEEGNRAIRQKGLRRGDSVV